MRCDPITCSVDPSDVVSEDLEPFFEGWAAPNRASSDGFVPYGERTVRAGVRWGRLIGFTTAMSDGGIFVFIPCSRS